MIMKYRSVLFDLDGTLLDTLKDIADSVNKALSSLGFPEHEVDAYKYFVGDGEDVLVLRALPEDHRDSMTSNNVLSLFHKLYGVHWGDNTRPFQGIPDLLDALTKVGIRMAVLSNKGQKSVDQTISAFLANWRFDVVLGALPSMPTKPDPTGALRIVTQMGLKTSDFLYLGDSGVDMKTAVAAAMYPVGALWGYRKADELLASGAKALAHKPEEILPLLNG